MEVKARELFSQGKYGEALGIYDKLLECEKCPAYLLAKADCLILMEQMQESLDLYKNIFRAPQQPSANELTNCVLGLAKFTCGSKSSVQEKDTKEKKVLSCDICESILFEPVTLSCGHSSCTLCLKNQKNEVCGVCGESFSLENQKCNVVLQAFLTKYFEMNCRSVQLRVEGNSHCSSKEYHKALGKYLDAASCNPSDHLLQSNLSFAFASLMRYEEALERAQLTCRLKPSWPKGYYRKGCALIGLSRNVEAAAAFVQCLARDRENQAVKDSLTKVVHGLFTDQKEGEMEKLVGLLSEERTQTERRNPDGVSDLPCCTNKMKDCLVEDLECTLCCRLYYEPVTTPCGHVFCRACLNRSLDHKPCCPICRYSLAQYLAERKQVVTAAVVQLVVTCFPAQYEERKKQHEEELEKLASISGDNREDVPIFVCTLALPTMPCPLHIFEPRYRLMVRRCLESGARQFGMCMPSTGSSFADFGCMLEIRDAQFLQDGRSLVDTVGGRRFKVLDRGMKDGYHTAKVEWLIEDEVPEDQLADLNELHSAVFQEAKQWFEGLPLLVKRRVSNSFAEMPAFEGDLSGLTHGPKWFWWVLSILPLPPETQLSILAMTSLKERLQTLRQIILLLGHT